MSKDSTKELALKPVYEKAVEVYATTPDIQHQDAAVMLGVSEKTLFRLRRDPNFWESVYNYYMVSFEGGVVDVLRAMLREAKAGNVQAGRLVLEHSGKLQKNINITIDSPFEKWMKQSDNEVKVVNAQDAEIVSDLEAISPEFASLPESSADNSPKHAMDELKKLRKAQNKAKSNINRNKLRREQHKWLKRAELAGIDPLPRKRPTAGQKKAWRDSIVAKELQMKASKSKKG